MEFEFSSDRSITFIIVSVEFYTFKETFVNLQRLIEDFDLRWDDVDGHPCEGCQ